MPKKINSSKDENALTYYEYEEMPSAYRKKMDERSLSETLFATKSGRDLLIKGGMAVLITAISATAESPEIALARVSKTVAMAITLSILKDPTLPSSVILGIINSVVDKILPIEASEASNDDTQRFIH